MANLHDSATRSGELVITIWSHGPLAIVGVAGELDCESSPKLLQCLRALTGDVRVDCRDLKFIDSSGLQVFVAVHRELRAGGRQLLISGLSTSCRRAFELTRLDTVLDLTG